MLAMAMFALAWYSVVVLVCYRTQLFGLFGMANRIRAGTLVNGVRQAKKDPAMAYSRASDSLMGASRLPEGVNVIGSQELRFSGPDPGERYGQLGLAADMLRELKVVFSELERSSGDKRDFFRMLAGVKEVYGPLLGHPSLVALTDFVRKHAPFHLDDEELERLWY